MQEDIICYCRRVSRATVQQAIEKGAKSLEDIRWSTDACKDNQCEKKHPKGISCEEEVKQMIMEYHGHIEGPKCSCGCCS